ncbi:MAG: hypothetical protein QW303_07400 [Nitrososphaerota archaeon]
MALGVLLISKSLWEPLIFNLLPPILINEDIPVVSDARFNNKLINAFDVNMNIAKWKTFTSLRLKYSFKYPSEWGFVKEEIRNAELDGKGGSGKIYRLSFSNLDPQADSDNLILVVGHSADFTVSRFLTDLDYKGDPTLPKKVKATIWAQPSKCNLMVKAYPYFGRIDFNLPDKDITGVRILMPVVSRERLRAFDGQFDAMLPNEQIQACEIENIEKDAGEFIKKLRSQYLDELSLKQLQVFEQIFNSAKVY